MANVPVPKSYEQILGDMLSTYMSKIGVNDLNVGSAVTSFFEAMAQAVYRASGDTFSILRDFSVDRATKEALKRLAEEEGIRLSSAQVATGLVNISDSGFDKISTKVYAGTPPPNIGSTSINVSDASEFPATGSIYIGRGTPNVEGPIPYSSITAVGSFYQINLSTPTSKYHNNSESVVLSQGGVRNIPTGTIVQTATGGAAPAVSFSVTKAATILDGENVITNVSVAAQKPGTDGNVPRNSIRNFVSAPFTNAAVTNPDPFTTGRNQPTDAEIKTAIKRARISRGLGTALAVENAVQGAQAPDENAIVTSDQIFTDGDKTTLFIDNGQGYEEKTRGVGLELIVDSALGGEDRFQLSTGGSQTSIAKAFLKSNQTAPFGINPNDRLAVLVGGVLSEHVFLEGDFRSNGFATAFEVVSSINSNSDLAFSARTIDNGTRVVLSAKSETEEFIQKTNPTTGNDAGIALGLAVTESQTLRLYKNNKPLSRNGRNAVLETQNQSSWSSTITTGETLIISVDGTSPITYTITDSDFAAEGTFSTVSNTNSLQSWVNVFNAKITGVTASINGNRVVFTSNLGTNSRAKLEIDSASTLVSKNMFASNGVLVSEGQEADFTLSRNTAQLKLTAPLEAGDSLTAGSDFTEGSIKSEPILGGSVTLPADAKMWFILDNQDAEIVPHGVTGDSIIHFSKQPSNILRLRSNITNAFDSVQPGDYVIIWSLELNGNNRLEGRVHATGTDVEANDYFEIKVTSSEYAAAVAESPVTYSEGLVFVRTDVPPQKVSIAAGSYNINTIANDLESQVQGLDTTTENDEIIILSTSNKEEDGNIFLPTFNDAAKNLNFTLGDSASSTFSHFGFFRDDKSSTGFPAFVHGKMSQDRTADPSSSFIANVESAIDLTALGVDPNWLMCMQNPYLSNGSYILDAQGYDECVQIDDISGGTTVDIDDSKTIKRVRIDDRFYVLRPLDFAYNDSITLVLDSNPAEKTFPINLYRRAITNTTMPINSDEFRAYDVDAGATTEFNEFFGDDFSFKNYKAMMQARNIIDPSSGTDEDAIIYRAAVWGKAGENYDVGYVYPTSANQSVSSTVTVLDKVRIRISLQSGAAVANNIDGTTEWDVTVSPNTPVAGVEEVTYTHNGTGTNPAMTTLTAGNYVTINGNGEFSSENTGTYRISSATSTSFTIRRKNGTGVAENNIATLTTNTISLFEDAATTAQDIKDHVDSDLSDWISAELLDDNGTTGAGEISLSTHEDNDFATDSESLSLVDGINWLASSDLDASAPDAQFEFKRTLQLPSFNTNTAEAYKFSDGEEVRFIPTTIGQLTEFINILAVTGFKTLGEISTAIRDQRLQLATQILGSDGSVQVSGGAGNAVQAQVSGSSIRVNGTDLMKTTISKASSNGINADSWLRLEASNLQRKDTGVSFTTQVTITPNQPSPTTSIVELGNRDIADRYFGEPRNFFRSRSRAFQVEYHGSLVNISWDEVTGSDPQFTKSVEFNDAAGGDMSVSFNSDFLTTEYTITSGDRNFTEAQAGDQIVIQNFADSENNGTFTVVGVSDDGLTISVDNQNGVSAGSATVASGDISITTDIKEGDTIEIAEPFDVLNQGSFRVVRRFENSIYIENDAAVEERVVVSDNLRDLGFDATTEFDVTVPGPMKIEWNGNGTEPTLENAKLGDSVTVGTGFASANQGTFMVVDSGDNYIELANSKAVAETNVTVTGVGGDILESQIPALTFSPYESTRAGDSLVISGDVLGENNQGTYTVTEVLAKDRLVVDDILEAKSSVQLNDLSVQFFIQEGKVYTGYKRVENIAANPANLQQVNLVFDTNEQFEKINQSAGILMTAQSKLGFTTDITSGFDSYKYHTGLLRQANKIVYGDPRDSVTFPGVAAAGAEIFIQPPLVRRVKVSINVRVNTGIPFIRITEQVRNNITALINSSEIGESIAISDIIATVNTIPGVRAVSISSPQYDPANDVIVIQPSEKPFVLDSINDINVSKVE